MRIGARIAVGCLLGLLLANPVVEAQEAGRTYRLGLLTIISEPADQASPIYSDAPSTDAFLAALRASGYVEGENLTFERRFADGKVDRLPALAAELVQLSPDAILTESTPATAAAQKATDAIPIVFNIGADPVAEGFVASLARPGGNLTGFYFGIYPQKSLQMLQEIVPGLQRVAFLCPTVEFERCSSPPPEEVENEISRTGVEIEIIEVTGSEAFDAGFEAARHAGAEAVLVVPMAWYYGYQRELGEAAARTPLPVIFESRIFVEAGGLIGYNVEISHTAQRTAAIVARILEGGDPGEIPVEQPTLFELWLNLKTARTWGIKLPPSLLVQATGVVE
jgi:putative tryptophan/tyrosine transport system substrate-binding protein